MKRNRFCEVDKTMYNLLSLRARKYKKMSELDFLGSSYSDDDFFIYYCAYLCNFYFKRCYFFDCFEREMFYENLINMYNVAKSKYDPAINKRFSTYLYYYCLKAFSNTIKRAKKSNCIYFRCKLEDGCDDFLKNSYNSYNTI